MNKESLKRLAEAHSWLGLIISAVLFVVFFAGSISLFRTEITQWSMQPHFALSQGKPLPLSEILASAIKDVPFDAKEHLTLQVPDKNIPYYRAYVDIEHQAGEEDHLAFYIDPITGKKIAEIDSFFLADFIFDLHVDLNIPAGKYVVGFVSLFFIFALISGIFIHARKLIGNFFKYRSKDTDRSKLLDMHSVVGVMSLPFTLMYAVSGLIFNLVIIYQIAFALVLYKGDQQSLLDDAGFKAVNAQWLGESWQAPEIDLLTQQTTEKYGIAPKFIRIYNYGDESAVIMLRGEVNNSLTDHYEVAYQLKDNAILFTNDNDSPNTFTAGFNVISKLHFGNFAGFDLRILYFILGMGVCSLIVTGNLLWIEKRSRQRNQSLKTLKFVRNFTLWISGGVIVATSAAFVVERLLPLGIENREYLMVYSFITTLCLTAIILIFNQEKKQFLGRLLIVSSALLVFVIMLDWLMFVKSINLLWQQNIKGITGIQIGLATMAVLFAFIGQKLTRNKVMNKE
jgi:uncharacterized iron-regulated membrane protein